jgi:hypothetical protein
VRPCPVRVCLLTFWVAFPIESVWGSWATRPDPTHLKRVGLSI